MTGPLTAVCTSVLYVCIGDKVAVVCNPQDTWFSQRSWEEMWVQVPKIKVRVCRAVPDFVTEHMYCKLCSEARFLMQAYMEEAQRHDFCVSARLSASLAHKSAEILEDVLPQKR